MPCTVRGSGSGSALAHILSGVFNSGRGGGMCGLLMLRISDEFAEETRINNAASISYIRTGTDKKYTEKQTDRHLTQGDIRYICMYYTACIKQ